MSYENDGVSKNDCKMETFGKSGEQIKNDFPERVRVICEIPDRLYREKSIFLPEIL